MARARFGNAHGIVTAQNQRSIAVAVRTIFLRRIDDCICLPGGLAARIFRTRLPQPPGTVVTVALTNAVSAMLLTVHSLAIRLINGRWHR